MPDDERETVTAERAASGEKRAGGSTEESATESATDSTTGATDLDDRVASFLDLERSLAARSGSDRARVVDAETVDAETIPSEYPRSTGSEGALALTLEHVETGDRSTAFFAWPPTNGSPLDRLLGAVGVERDSFADLHGRRLLVRLEDGHVLPVVPPEGPDGTRHGLTGIVAGHLANAAAVVGAVLGVVDPLTLFVALLLVNLVVLPAATYFDAWHLKRTTDWDQAPSFWAVLQAIPGANVLAAAAYVRSRRAARPIDDP